MLNMLTIENDFNIDSSFLYRLFFVLNFMIFNMKFETGVRRISLYFSIISKWFHNMFLFSGLLYWLMNENYGYHHDSTMESKNRFIITFIHLFLFS
jgi:hypothetical protein